MTLKQERKLEHGDENSRCAEERGVLIIVNGREKLVQGEELTFDGVINLAFDDPPKGEFICFTITYRNAAGPRPEGTLIEGETINIREGMVLNVTVTDKS